MTVCKPLMRHLGQFLSFCIFTRHYCLGGPASGRFLPGFFIWYLLYTLAPDDKKDHFCPAVGLETLGFGRANNQQITDFLMEL